MKKVIALVMAVVMTLALGVTAFAAEVEKTATIEGWTSGETFEIDKEKGLVIMITGGQKDMVVSDANGIFEFTTPVQVSGGDETRFTVSATAQKLGLTRIQIKDKDGNDITNGTYYVEVKDPDVVDPYDGAVLNDTSAVQLTGSKVILDIEGFEGISYEVYNEAAKLSPEQIVIKNNTFTLTLNRGDYTKQTLNKHLYFNVLISNTPTASGVTNNKVLKALGNTKADPFYVEIRESGLSNVAAKPELVIDMYSNANWASWLKTNNAKNMIMYQYNTKEESITTIKKSLSVDSLLSNKVTSPTTQNGVYFLVDANNAAGSNANTGSGSTQKPNTNTGANDMIAVVVVFATIALAAGVSKKVR